MKTNIVGMVNPLYTDTRYNDKLCYNDWLETFAQEVRVNKELCKILYLILQETYGLDIC